MLQKYLHMFTSPPPCHLVLCTSETIDLFGPFQVVDLQVFAAPRITLKPLLPVFPCFANIYVSLLEKVRGDG
jgi:hypothetical protein